jgi:hypothetical protein
MGMTSQTERQFPRKEFLKCQQEMELDRWAWVPGPDVVLVIVADLPHSHFTDMAMAAVMVADGVCAGRELPIRVRQPISIPTQGKPGCKIKSSYWNKSWSL